METKLVLFRNELKSKTVPKYKTIGIVSEIILSREIFQSNAQLEDFLRDVFSLSFKPYLFRSRTLVVARTIRVILSTKDDMMFKTQLYNFIQELIEKFNQENKTKNQFNGWL